MYNKGVVLYIPADIYNILGDEQEKRRTATGKKPTLAAIIYEYFTVGLQSSLSGLLATPENKSETTANIPSTIQLQHKALELTQKEKRLEEKEVWLNSRGREINIRDRDQRKKELAIGAAYDEMCQKKIEFADSKELSAEKIAENVSTKITLNHLEKANQKLNEATITLQEEIKFLKSKVLIALDKVCNQVNDLPQKNVWRDYVIPILPSVLIVIQFFLTNKTLNSADDIKKAMGEFKGVFNGMDEKKIADILKMWREMNGENNKSRSP